MREGRDLKKFVTDLIIDFVKEYPVKRDLPRLWREPLVGFADAYDPYIQRLPQIVADIHKLPQDFMENPTVVISYFVPFTREAADTNVNTKGRLPSAVWAEAYEITNTMMERLDAYLSDELAGKGYRAAVPAGIGMVEELIMSGWSQRHLAYAAGLGTFGINNMLITERGCCGRYHSIVADIPVKPSERLGEEYCLYKSFGSCKKCVENCFSGALTEEGFDRRKCLDICMANMKVIGADVCGKCDTDIPCAFEAPRAERDRRSRRVEEYSEGVDLKTEMSYDS